MSALDPDHPDYSLRYLAHVLEQNPMTINEIPTEFVDYFGLSNLFNSVTILLPKVPHYEKTIIQEYMKNHSYLTLPSLVEGISFIHNDINKFYAIYYYFIQNFTFIFNEKTKKTF